MLPTIPEALVREANSRIASTITSSPCVFGFSCIHFSTGMHALRREQFFAAISLGGIMKSRRTSYVGLLFVFVLVAGLPSNAQSGDQGKPPVYTYVSEWAVPRAQ